MKAFNSLGIGVAAALAMTAGVAVAHGPHGACGADAAQPAWCGQQGGGPGAGMFGAGAAQLETARAALQLTPAQQAAWDRYAATVLQQADAATRARAGFHESMQSGNVTAEQMTQWRETMRAFNAESWSARIKARDELYAVLTPDQKAVADRYLRMGAAAWAGAGGGHRHGTN